MSHNLDGVNNLVAVGRILNLWMSTLSWPQPLHYLDTLRGLYNHDHDRPLSKGTCQSTLHFN